jgi:hypothetical protein
MNNAYTLAWCLQHPLKTPTSLMQITMETDWNVFSNYSYSKKLESRIQYMSNHYLVLRFVHGCPVVGQAQWCRVD